MAYKTTNDMTDVVWNPVSGLGEVTTHSERLDQPLHWHRPRRVRVSPLGDLFDPAVTSEFLDQVFGLMWACINARHGEPGHVFQIQTRHAQRMRDYLKRAPRGQWARAAADLAGGHDPDGIYDLVLNAEGPHPRLWLGVEVESQASANERVSALLETPSVLRFVCCEPLLGPVDLCMVENHGLAEGQRYLNALEGYAWEDQGDDDFDVDSIGARIDWVVVGGEVGPKARPMHPQWARELRDQCAAAGVPFQFKQWGEWYPANRHAGDDLIERDRAKVKSGFFDHCGTWNNQGPNPLRQTMDRLGLKAAGRLLDGELHDAQPV